MPLNVQAWLPGPRASTILVPGAALACLATIDFTADPRFTRPPTSTPLRDGQDQTRPNRQQQKVQTEPVLVP